MSKAFGIKPKNKEQGAALEALLNPEIDLVILDGLAGSGKTLLSIAAGLQQTMENPKLYNKILFTRAPVAVGFDLGHLPGTLEEKLAPWAAAVEDNLEFLGVSVKDAERYIQLCSMAHMRGRSLASKWLIIDEIQNISVQQIQILVTRAGENTKIVCLGDTSQTDNKTLSKTNNAMYYLVHMGNKPEFIRHIKLVECERSRLAAWAAKEIEV